MLLLFAGTCCAVAQEYRFATNLVLELPDGDGIDSVTDTNTSVVATSTNAFPLAQDDTIQSPPTNVVHIAAVLLLNDTDPESDPLNIVSVANPSLGGANVTLNGTEILYTPRGGYIGADSFTYTVDDGHGGQAVATVNIAMDIAQSNITGRKITKLDGSLGLGFSGGIPGTPYTIEYTDTLFPPNWKTLGTVIADANGNINIDDSFLHDLRFYRIVYP